MRIFGAEIECMPKSYLLISLLEIIAGVALLLFNPLVFLPFMLGSLLFVLLLIKPEIGILSLVFMFPLSKIIGYDTGYFYLTPVIFLTVLTGIAWLVGNLSNKRLKINKRPEYIPLILFLLIALFSAICNRDSIGFMRSISVLGLVAVMFLIGNVISDETNLKRCVYIMLISAIILIIAGIVELPQLASNLKAHHATRLTAFYNDANFFAATLQLYIPLALLGTLGFLNISSFFSGFLLMLLIVTLIFTFSRMGIIAFITTLIIFTIFSKSNRQRILRLILILSTVLIVSTVVISTLINPKVLSTQWQRISDLFVKQQEDEAIQLRLSLLKTAKDMLADHPFVGTSLGGYRSKYLEYASSYLDRPHYSHNVILQLVSETGVIGLALFTCFIFMYIKATITRLKVMKNTYLRMILLCFFSSSIAIMLHMMTASLFFEESLWITIGLTHAVINVSETQKLHAIDVKKAKAV